MKPEDTYIGASNTCWAVDAAERNNKYYYYFSNGKTDTGVAVSDSPIGPFADALGKPILTKGLTKTAQYDPTVFVDPDTDIPYIIWGGGSGYYIARLQENMIALANRRGAQMKAPSERAPRGKYAGGVLEYLRSIFHQRECRDFGGSWIVV